MEQIRFEVKLYYNFSNQLQPAFEENNKNMEKLKEEKLAEYNYEAKGAERQMSQMEYGELRELRQFELIKKAGGRYVCPFEILQ
jgi:primosomal protein N''